MRGAEMNRSISSEARPRIHRNCFECNQMDRVEGKLAHEAMVVRVMPTLVVRESTQPRKPRLPLRGKASNPQASHSRPDVS